MLKIEAQAGLTVPPTATETPAKEHNSLLTAPLR